MKPLNEEAIRKNYDPSLNDTPIYIYEEVDSTNTRLIELSSEYDLPSFTLCVSEFQSHGKGRLGRGFQSPKGTGIYMSILIHEEIGPFDLLTIQAAVAVAEAIETITGLNPQIKWVNDLYLNGKKICGILSQGMLSQDAFAKAVVGIGINVNTPASTFLPEIQSKAGSLQVEIDRNELIGEIVTRYKDIVTHRTRTEVIEAYKSRCFILGEKISFEKDGRIIYGTAANINSEGHLIVQTAEGLIELSTGEVSIYGSWSKN